MCDLPPVASLSMALLSLRSPPRPQVCLQRTSCLLLSRRTLRQHTFALDAKRNLASQALTSVQNNL
jgi:hypothetical protein